MPLHLARFVSELLVVECTYGAQLDPIENQKKHEEGFDIGHETWMPAVR